MVRSGRVCDDKQTQTPVCSHWFGKPDIKHSATTLGLIKDITELNYPDAHTLLYIHAFMRWVTLSPLDHRISRALLPCCLCWFYSLFLEVTSMCSISTVGPNERLGNRMSWLSIFLGNDNLWAIEHATSASV